MTKQELGKYAGNRIFALCRRMGGMFKDIDCLTVYQITQRGTLRYMFEAMPCVANKSQFEQLHCRTNGNFVVGRPTAASIDKADIDALISV